MGEPAVSARSNPGEPPAHVITTVEFGFFGNQQAQKRPAYISKTNDGEVVRRNICSSSRMSVSQASLSAKSSFLFRGEFCSGGRNECRFVSQHASHHGDCFVRLFPLLLLDGFAHGGHSLHCIAGI